MTVEHARLADAEHADETTARWRERLTALKAQLEHGDTDA